MRDKYPSAIQGLFSFRGRIGRAAFAGFGLVVVGCALTLLYYSVVLAGNDRSSFVSAISGIMFVLSVLCVWPVAALIAKRLHDLNRSGWHGLWLLLWVVPWDSDLVSAIVNIAAAAALIWLVAMPGTPVPKPSGAAE